MKMGDRQLVHLSEVMGHLAYAFQLQGRFADAYEVYRQRVQLLRMRRASPSLVRSG